MTETLRTVDGRGVLRIERALAHPPEKVWRAVTEPEHLQHWFPFAVEVEPTPGGKITFRPHGDPGGDHAAALTHGQVLDADPPRLFAFTWEGDELRFELRPDGASTLLIFTHTFGDLPGAASFTAGWMACLDGLDRLLGAGPTDLRPDMVEMDARHEHYIAEFGMADGSATETEDGWQVRFERQLTRPAHTVWAALSGDVTAAVGAPPPVGFTTGEITPGPVTALEPARALEYEWTLDAVPSGRVRWELTEGTGQGARLILVQTGPAPAALARATALTAWRARVESLAAHLLTLSR